MKSGFTVTQDYDIFKTDIEKCLNKNPALKIGNDYRFKKPPLFSQKQKIEENKNENKPKNLLGLAKSNSTNNIKFKNEPKIQKHKTCANVGEYIKEHHLAK